MTRTGSLTLAVLWLAGCGIYGPPERAVAKAPAAAQSAELPDETCEDGEEPE